MTERTRKWHKIKDQLPPLDEEVLISRNESMGVVCGYLKDENSYARLVARKPNKYPVKIVWCVSHGYESVHDEDYWRPLPYPPCPLYDPPNNCRCNERADEDSEGMHA